MFLLRPRPFPDESISSWRQRTGFANGFWRFPSPRGNRHSTDPDRLPSQDEQQWLSNQCGISPQTISALSLEARLAQFQIRDVFTPRLRWVLTLGQHSESGPMFCPECLRTDELPYFRAHWRYAFLTECPVHQSPLLDKCPHCDQLIWPAAVKSLARQKPWRNLTDCPYCQFDLKSSQVKTDGSASVSNRLWAMLSNNEVAGEFRSIPTLPAFFDGLWVLSQLLLRRSGQPVLQKISMGFDNPPKQPKSGPELIEGLAAAQRRKIVAGAYWLMEKWPERFLSIATAVGITKATFIPTSATNPSWLTDTLDAELARHNKRITTGDVSQAIENLKNEGRTASKKAVRQQLKVSESKVIDSVLSRRNHARPDELMILIRKFEHRLAITSTSRDQKATLLRDYLIFILSVLEQCPIDEVCTLSAKDVENLLFGATTTSQNTVEIEKSLIVRAKALNSEYATDVRPKFIKRDSPPGRWFIGREGKEFAGHTLRERIAKLMRKDFAEDIWHSCDAFVHALGTPPLGRRVQRRQRTFTDEQDCNFLSSLPKSPT